MHVGILVEERRRGSSEGAALQDAVELAASGRGVGARRRVAGRDPLHAQALGAVSPDGAGELPGRPDARVRIGTAVTVLPLAHPLRIAEEVATVDHLSQGRFDFGIGRSGAASTYDVLGVRYAESQARFEEALVIIREAWKGEPFSYQGQFHRIENAVVTPRPYQMPHPPLRMAASSPETFPWVGRAGLPLFVGLRDLDIPALRMHLESYRAAWRQAGHAGAGDVCLRIPVYAAPTEQAAREEPRENITYFFQRHTELTRARLGRAGAGPAARIQSHLESLMALTYDRILETQVAFGAPARLAERLGRLRDDLGLDGSSRS